ncbi:unnamed protein product [Lathyrus sativus]|nr:unnamed protein product [Lathyrus sativus]
MLVTGWLPAYVKISPQLDRLVAKPFYNQKSTNRSLKCSPQPQLQLGSNPFQPKNLKRCYCKTKDQDTPFASDSPWESGDIWTNLALYLFTLHIPLSFGGLSVVSLLTGQQPLLHPQTQPLSNPSLKEILLDSDISRVCCVVAYCIVTPLLEEVVYRGFLLTSLSSTMKWQQAVAISSVIFSAIHFSVENFVQLFIIGCALGCSYCWTRNLNSSIAIHSLYNALTLLITYFY